MAVSSSRESVGSNRRWSWSEAWWLLPALLAVGLTLLFMVVLPANRTIDSVWEVPWRLSPVVCAVVAIAGFPRRTTWGLVCLALLFIGYMGAVDTANVLAIFDFVEAGGTDEAFPDLYEFTIFVNAFTVLAILFAYRLGGASGVRVLQAGLAGVLIVISGLNDLTMWAFNDWESGRPERLDWASHISVFVGGPPSPLVALAFLLVHLGLAILLLTPAAGRRIQRAGRWVQARAGQRSA